MGRKRGDSRKKNNKERWTKVAILFLFLVGALTAGYPFYSDAFNSFLSQQMLNRYQKAANQENADKTAEIRKEMAAQNEILKDNTHRIGSDPFQLEKQSKKAIVHEDYLIGSLTIPKINLLIAVYDHTNDLLLEHGAVVLDGTSFPVGGESTHSVISAHRGLSNNKFFTDLPELEEGDQFVLTILDQKLAYEIRGTEVIEPTTVEALKIVSGEDRVTLMTCTPYMINSHRLLVYGYRIPYTEEMEEETRQVETTSKRNQMMILAATGFISLLFLFLLYKIIRKRKK